MTLDNSLATALYRLKDTSNAIWCLQDSSQKQKKLFLSTSWKLMHVVAFIELSPAARFIIWTLLYRVQLFLFLAHFFVKHIFLPHNFPLAWRSVNRARVLNNKHLYGSCQ